MKKKKSKRKKCLGQKAGSNKVKTYYLAEIGYKKGDGISDKTGKSDLGQKFLVRGEDLALISQATRRKSS